MHSCMFLSPVNDSSDYLHIYLVLLSVDLLGVRRRGGFSSRKVYTRLFHLDWTYDANIWMKDVQGGDILALKGFSQVLHFG